MPCLFSRASWWAQTIVNVDSAVPTRKTQPKQHRIGGVRRHRRVLARCVAVIVTRVEPHQIEQLKLCSGGATCAAGVTAWGRCLTHLPPVTRV